MFLAELRRQVRALKEDVVELIDLQRIALEQQRTLTEGFITMTTKADELKALIGDIGNDVTEIDGDLQEVLDKLAAFGSTPTAEELAEITTMLSDLKGRTRAAADKVPEP